jgi:ABC-type transport system substrate-binding protein
LDKCLVEGEAEYDFNKRSEIYKRCQRIIYEDALVGATHWRPFTLTSRSELKGVRLQAISLDFFEAWLDK